MRRSVRRDQRGSAVADFVLVLIIVIPIVLGVLQVALVLFVRNTLAAAASEGARHAATLDRGPLDGEALTRSRITDVVAGRFAQGVRAQEVLVQGVPGVAVTVRASVPVLGLGGPSVDLQVVGRAVEESQ